MTIRGTLVDASNPLTGLELAPLVWASDTMIAIAIGPDGLMTAANPVFERMAGLDVRGRDVATVVAAGQADAFRSWVLAATDSWSARTWGLVPLGSDATPRDYGVAARRTPSGDIVMVGDPHRDDDVVAAIFDVNASLIGERRRLERERTALGRAARKDALTGVANRAAFDARLDLEVQRAQSGDGFAVVMLDIDHFKGLNDRFGHQAGDAVLRWLGALLRQAARKGDFVARYGGEEFVAILADAEADGATVWADRLRSAIGTVQAPVVDITVTASLGVAAWVPGEVGPDVIGRADRALYRAKATGRNRVVADQAGAAARETEDQRGETSPSE